MLVVNDTGKAGTAIVDATVTGARLRGGAHQEMAMPAGGRVPSRSRCAPSGRASSSCASRRRSATRTTGSS